MLLLFGISVWAVGRAIAGSSSEQNSHGFIGEASAVLLGTVKRSYPYGWQ